MGFEKSHIASSLQIVKIATKIGTIPNLRMDPGSEEGQERFSSQFSPRIWRESGTEIADDYAETSRIRIRNESPFAEDLTRDERDISLVFLCVLCDGEG